MHSIGSWVYIGRQAFEVGYEILRNWNLLSAYFVFLIVHWRQQLYNTGHALGPQNTVMHGWEMWYDIWILVDLKFIHWYVLKN